jgi:ATP-dependent HslUV protease, peptidase subunit HslV
MPRPEDRIRSTTVIAVRRGDAVAVAGDGQVTLGNTVMKGTAKKVRRMHDGNVIVGFAGASADAFTLFERLEAKLKEYNGNLTRACVELAKDWRMDRMLRRLEAMLIAADKKSSFLVSGTGDVIEPDSGILAIGSGGSYALSAARALARHTELSAADIARTSLQIASEICIYTNSEIVLEEIRG